MGNLTGDVHKDELKRVCGEFGSLRKVWLAHNPPGFAFVDFYNSSDAQKCVRSLDGREVWRGCVLRVELSTGDEPRSRQIMSNGSSPTETSSRDAADDDGDTMRKTWFPTHVSAKIGDRWRSLTGPYHGKHRDYFTEERQRAYVGSEASKMEYTEGRHRSARRHQPYRRTVAENEVKNDVITSMLCCPLCAHYQRHSWSSHNGGQTCLVCPPIGRLRYQYYCAA